MPSLKQLHALEDRSMPEKRIVWQSTTCSIALHT